MGKAWVAINSTNLGVSLSTQQQIVFLLETSVVMLLFVGDSVTVLGHLLSVMSTGCLEEHHRNWMRLWISHLMTWVICMWLTILIIVFNFSLPVNPTGRQLPVWLAYQALMKVYSAVLFLLHWTVSWICTWQISQIIACKSFYAIDGFIRCVAFDVCREFNQ